MNQDPIHKESPREWTVQDYRRYAKWFNECLYPGLDLDKINEIRAEQELNPLTEEERMLEDESLGN